MYAISNRDASNVVELLLGDYGRVLVQTTVSGYSFCDAILHQISHDRNKFKAINMLQQMAYFMVKNPDLLFDVTKPFLGKHSYESYAKNMYHGTKFIDVEVATAILALMWNM